MPIRNLTPEQEEAYRAAAVEERKDAHEVRAQRYAHEFQLAKLQSAVDGRHATVKAICKTCILPLAVVCVTVLTLAGRPIPEPLQELTRL